MSSEGVMALPTAPIWPQPSVNTAILSGGWSFEALTAACCSREHSSRQPSAPIHAGNASAPLQQKLCTCPCLCPTLPHPFCCVPKQWPAKERVRGARACQCSSSPALTRASLSRYAQSLPLCNGGKAGMCSHTMVGWDGLPPVAGPAALLCIPCLMGWHTVQAGRALAHPPHGQMEPSMRSDPPPAGGVEPTPGGQVSVGMCLRCSDAPAAVLAPLPLVWGG